MKTASLKLPVCITNKYKDNKLLHTVCQPITCITLHYTQSYSIFHGKSFKILSTVKAVRKLHHLSFLSVGYHEQIQRQQIIAHCLSAYYMHYITLHSKLQHISW